MERKDIPIILTAFGTTAKAFETYEKMDAVFKQVFPDNPLHWAYSSRMVKCTLNKKQKMDLKGPVEIARTLVDQDYPWAVLQSLHLACGHEFDRLVTERDTVNIRSSIGLPLLTSHQDYEKVSSALAPLFPEDPDEAVILVGHGTDHPAWSTYPALEAVMRQQHGHRIFVGVLEGFPGAVHTLKRIQKAGYNKVHIIPLILVAGFHFKKELTSEEDSWQATFEKNGVQVSLVDHGVGENKGITEIFCDHIAEALDVIPI